MLDLAGHDDLGADGEPALDEAPAEPGRLDRAGLVLEAARSSAGSGRRNVGLDPDVADPRPGRDTTVAVLDPDELAELAHLAQVVVAPGQVEQQVADGVEAELDARPAAAARARRPARTRAQRRSTAGCDRVGRRPARRASVALATAYSAEIR